MGFLTPLGEPRSRTVAQTGAELQVVAPETDRFTLEGYHDALQTYLHDALAMRYPELEVYRAVDEHALCLDHPEASALDRLTDTDGPFGFAKLQEFSLRVLNAAVDSLSMYHHTKSDLEQSGSWTRKQIHSRCRDHSPETTTCVPVFRRKRSKERIDLYFVEQGPDGEPTAITVEGGFKLL